MASVNVKKWKKQKQLNQIVGALLDRWKERGLKKKEWMKLDEPCYQIRSDQISHSVVSDSLRPHESQQSV